MAPSAAKKPSPEELAAIAANRAIIEQAKGMLMVAYDIDADNAFELLKWGSQATNVKLHALARQLTEELVATAHSERAVLRSACDNLLFAANEHVGPTPRPGRRR